MAQVMTYTGTAASPRTQAIDRHLLSAPASTCLIVPTQRVAQQRMRQLLNAHPDFGGFMGRPIMTFQDFAAGLLRESDDSFPLVTATTQQLLLKRSIQLAKDDTLLDFLGDAADRPGFVHHIQRLIAQLKQSAIDPPTFRESISKRKHRSPFDTVVAEIYANYQNLLLASKTFDLQGMYWLADMACEYKKPKSLEAINTLLIDGFDDFTPSEFRLIQSLEGHLDTLIFGLNYDVAPHRRDAYAVVHATHEHIQQSFNVSAQNFEEEVPPATTQCEHVSRVLFGRDSSDRQALAASLDANLTLLPCHTITHEVESIARTIKHQVLHDGVVLSDILIVFNHPEAYAHTVTQVFGEAGIPLQPIQTTTLAHSSMADFLLKLYESTAQWERESILHVLTSPLFQTWAQSPPEHVATYRHIAYRAEVIDGAKQWSARLGSFSERLLKRTERQVDRWLHHMPHLQEACASLMNDVERLKNLTENIPAKVSLDEHIEAFQGVREAFVRENIMAVLHPTVQEREFHAWDALKTLVCDIQRTSELMHTELSRGDFVGQLQELYGLTSLIERTEPGGVLCLRLEDARHIEMPFVYVCGVNEGMMPAPPPVNAIYTQFDRQELVKAGMHMPSNREHAEKERLQFLRIFSIPTDHLTLSWYACTQQGQELNKSPFIQDILDLGLGQSAVLESIMNVREAVNTSVGEAKPLSSVLTESVSRALSKSHVEKKRYARSAFDEYDGVLSTSPVVAQVAGHYNTQHPFSAYQIETYIDCPFRFMVRAVLNVSERETPALSFDRKLMGIIYHNALEEFYTHYTGQLLEDIELDEITGTMERIAGEVFTHAVGAFAEAYPGIARVERARIFKKLHQHVENHHRNGSEGWRPSHAEVSFGEALNSRSDSLSNPEFFSLSIDDHDYRFTGRIDRVDVNDQGEARIVDYKSSLGSIAEKDINEGRNIQLSLYAMALEQVLMPTTICRESIYLKIGNDDTRGNPKKKGEPREAAQESIAQTIHNIQAGIFHPKAHEKSCKYCPSNKVCRFEEGRIAGKTQT